MRTLLIAMIAIVGFIGYAMLWPSRFEPEAWHAPAAHAGDSAIHPISGLTRLGIGAGAGPETVAVGPDDRLYTRHAKGTIRRFDADTAAGNSSGDVFATSNGRPLGLAFGPPLPRQVIHRPPAWAQPALAHVSHIVHIANDGHVIDQRIDDSARTYAPVTSVIAHGDWLYLGSLGSNAIGRVPRTS